MLRILKEKNININDVFAISNLSTEVSLSFWRQKIFLMITFYNMLKYSSEEAAFNHGKMKTCKNASKFSTFVYARRSCGRLLF